MKVKSGPSIRRDTNDLQELRERIERIHLQSGGGLLRLGLFDDAAGAELIVASFLGNREATKLARMVASTVGQIGQSAGGPAPALCVCCLRSVQELAGVRIGVLTAAGDNAVDALGFAICPQCSAESDLHKRIIEALRGIWPSLKQIEITHAAGGHA